MLRFSRSCRHCIALPLSLPHTRATLTSAARGHVQSSTKTRELPEVKSTVRKTYSLGILLITLWSAFLLFATNEERLSSSVIRRITATLISNTEVRGSLGRNIALEPSWYMFGAPRIAGQINQLQGNVDVVFRISGEKGSGTVYFSSIRRAKGKGFETLRFKVITDNGEALDLSSGASVS